MLCLLDKKAGFTCGKPGQLLYSKKKDKQIFSYFAYRHITDNWYLCHIVDD